MRGVKIALIAILSGFILVLIGGMLWGMSRWGSLAGNSLLTELGQSKLLKTTTLDVVGMERLKIDYSNTSFDVVFLPSEKDELIVEEYFNKDVIEEKLALIELNGSTLSVKQRHNPGINFGLGNNISGYIKIYLPAKAYAALTELEVATTGGDIDIPLWEDVEEGSFAMEKVALSSVSGEITAAYLEGDTIKLASTSGDITAGSICGNLTMSTTSGRLKVEQVTGETDMKSVSGDIRLGSVIGEIKAGSTSGDITLTN